MEEIAISKFKATCLAVLERVRKTGRPVLVTRFGEPIAQVVPPSAKKESARELGAFRGTARITAISFLLPVMRMTGKFSVRENCCSIPTSPKGPYHTSRGT